MFDFTTNRKKTIKIGITIILASLPYLIFYQYVLSKVIDKYIPDKNINMVWIVSLILIAIIIIRFLFDKYSEVQRKTCYYDNHIQIKNKIFNSIQYANISKLDKIQVGKLFNLTTTQSFEASQIFMEANKIILENKISFLIAHRINTIKNADLIVFIDDKRIVEMGNHQELIEKHGYYYNLYMSKEEVLNN